MTVRYFLILFCSLFFVSGWSQIALDVNGSNQYARTNLGVTTANFTLEMDVYPKGGDATLDRLFSVNTANYFDVAIDGGGNVRVFSNQIGIGSWILVTSLPVGSFSHLAFVRQNNELWVFRNGTPVNVVPCSPSSIAFSQFALGTTLGLFSQNANVRVDNFRLWNSARTNAEIQNNYTACLTGSESGLMVLYDFEAGAGTTANDLAPLNGNNSATLYNGAGWGPGFACSSPCTNPTLPNFGISPGPHCAGQNVTLTIFGSLNGAAQWTVYSGSCGGTLVGTTTTNTITVPVSAGMTLYVRGEGGCITPGACATYNLTVTDVDNDGFDACQDCDDMDNTIYPGAPELCDGIDNDCDGIIDNNIIVPQTFETTSFSAFCSVDTAIHLTASQANYMYYLRDDANDSVVSEPVFGTGGPISLPTNLVNSTTTFNVIGSTPAYALKFDGVDDYITTSTIPNVTTAMTVEAWIQPTKNTGVQNVISKSSFAQNTGFIFPRTDDGWNTISGYLHIGGAWQVISAPYPGIGEWHRVALSYDGTTARLYIDGVEVNTLSVSGSVATNTNGVTLGNQPGYSEYYGGKLDNISLWNIVRTPAEILAATDDCYRNYIPNRLMHFEMEEGPGNNYIDDPSYSPAYFNNMSITESWVPTSIDILCNACSEELSQLVTITIDNTISTTESVSACGSYTWEGTTYSSSGSYTTTLTSVGACDSTVTLNLTINSPYTGSETVSACNEYTWNGTNYSASGVYTWTGTSAAGCDSTLTLNLTILNSTSSTTTVSACSDYDWNGNTYTTSGTYTYQTTNAAGCDSTATLNLTIHNSYSNVEDVTACDAFLWNGTTYTASGTYIENLTSAAGCDSVLTLNLTIITITPEPVTTGNAQLCPGNTGTTIDIPNSEVNVNYSLYDANTSALIAGPIPGTGGPLSFSTGALSSTTTYKVIGENLTNAVGNALQFDGIDDHLLYPNNQLIGGYAAFETWLYLESYGSGSTIIQDNDWYHFYIDSNGNVHVADYYWGSILDYSLAPNVYTVPLNQWVNIGAVRENLTGHFTVFINGTMVGSTAGNLNYIGYTAPSVPAPLTVGGNPNGLPIGGYLDGKIDELAIWASYDWAHMTDISCIDVNAPELMFYMGMEEGSGNYAFDAFSAPQNPFTLTNMDPNSAWTSGVECGTCSAEMANQVTVSVGQPNSSSTIVNACDNYVWNGTNYLVSGIYTWMGTNASGCDSTATLNLTINNSTSSSNSMTACDSYTWNGTNYTASGVYTWTGTNAVGCDSIATLNLTINNFTTSTTAVTACDDYTWNGTNYTASGVYTWTGTNAAGCDSTATLNLTINNSTTSTTAVTVCDSYTWNGTNYTISGVYTWAGTNAAGCDSTATLNLTINNSTTSIATVAACDSYTWNGTNYTASGVYTWMGTNAVGCDSIATLNLTINNSTTSTMTVTECDSYTWNSTNYTTSGVYTWTGTNAVGCDSIATLNLTINNFTTSTTAVTACDDYTWNGTNYTTSGVYTWTGTNAAGCDSIATLNLTINNSTTSSATVTACDSYTWNSTNYTTSGVYTWTGTNAAGCDSTATLNLTINNSTTSTTAVTACDEYTWNGTNFMASGVYTWTGTNAAGCDSIATLNLTILNPTWSTTTVIECGSYTWNGTNYSASGTYTWTGTNAAGCDSTATLNLTINTVDASVTDSSPTLTANLAGASYQWIDCGNNNSAIAGETGQSFTASVNGNYAVIVTLNNCSDTSDCLIVNNIGLDEVAYEQVLKAYPNPFGNSFHIELSNPVNQAKIEIHAADGRLIAEYALQGKELIVDASRWESGVYYLSLLNQDQRQMVRLVKQ